MFSAATERSDRLTKENWELKNEIKGLKTELDKKEKNMLKEGDFRIPNKKESEEMLNYFNKSMDALGMPTIDPISLKTVLNKKNKGDLICREDVIEEIERLRRDVHNTVNGDGRVPFDMLKCLINDIPTIIDILEVRTTLSERREQLHQIMKDSGLNEETVNQILMSPEDIKTKENDMKNKGDLICREDVIKLLHDLLKAQYSIATIMKEMEFIPAVESHDAFCNNSLSTKKYYDKINDVDKTLILREDLYDILPKIKSNNDVILLTDLYKKIDSVPEIINTDELYHGVMIKEYTILKNENEAHRGKIDSQNIELDNLRQLLEGYDDQLKNAREYIRKLEDEIRHYRHKLVEFLRMRDKSEAKITAKASSPAVIDAANILEINSLRKRIVELESDIAKFTIEFGLSNCKECCSDIEKELDIQDKQINDLEIGIKARDDRIKEFCSVLSIIPGYISIYHPVKEVIEWIENAKKKLAELDV
jgi:hypothetical protein